MCSPLLHPSAKQTLGVLDRVQIWTPRRPRDSANSKTPYLLLHGSGTMSWRVIFLQFPVSLRLSEVGCGPTQKLVSENSLVGLLVDILPQDHQLGLASCVDCSPNVHRSTSVGDRLLQAVRGVPLHTLKRPSTGHRRNLGSSVKTIRDHCCSRLWYLAMAQERREDLWKGESFGFHAGRLECKAAELRRLRKVRVETTSLQSECSMEEEAKPLALHILTSRQSVVELVAFGRPVRAASSTLLLA